MKIIKNDKEYEIVLARAEVLVNMDPEDNTLEAEELDLLTLLINKYEDEVYPIDLPDPAEVLIADPGKNIPEAIEGVNWRRFPLAEMVKNGWIIYEGSIQSAKENSEELIRGFFSMASFSLQNSTVFLRKSFRSDKTIDEYALAVWQAKVLIDQNNIFIENKYKEETLEDDFFDKLRVLSFFDEGPLLAREYLLKFGIKLIVVPHLKGILIDGAVFFNSEMDPVIGLTLRYDRLDYFWFTLFHELAHLALHLNNNNDYFFDDLNGKGNLSDIEIQADSYAQEKLISSNDWMSFYTEYLSIEDIKDFARQQRISPAIVAGRVQKERDDYKLFRSLLGQGKVKRLFEGSE